jgi:DNA-binding response OmpR family regulator
MCALPMKKVLVIDDDVYLLDVLQMALTDAGYSVKCVTLVNDLSGLIKDFNPDLILIDLILNGAHGGDVCAYLKQQAETANLPIVIFTAGHNPEWRAGSFGCDEFIFKPFDLFDLIDKVSYMLRVGVYRNRAESTNI